MGVIHMNKQEYLRLLRQQSNPADSQALNEAEAYVQRFFDEKAAKGLSEREIIALLGNPTKLLVSKPKLQPETDVVEDRNLEETTDEVMSDKTTVNEDTSEVKQSYSSTSGKSSGSLLRLILGLMIGLPMLLVLTALVLSGITASSFAFLQGLIMTFDLPFRIWQFPFNIREDFALLVGIGLIMVSSGMLTLFLSSLVGLYHGYKGLIKGNFR
jgi:uncharacterized membrane protein